MRKVVLFISFGIVGIGVYFGIKYLFGGVNIGGLIPLFTPSRKDIVQYLPQGSDLKYPLDIPDGYRLAVFADLKEGSPRVLKFDPRGTLVASITNKGKVVALPDKNADGIADSEIQILSDLDKPHGLAFFKGYIYVAETNGVARYLYDPVTFRTSRREVLFSLPGGGNHFTRTISIISDKLYTSVGSSCNVCEEKDSYRASILVSEVNGDNLTVFASGLRNTVFFVNDTNGNIWGADMGRDKLGDNLPPEEINIINEGNFGWPYCYGNKTRDAKFSGSQGINACVDTIVPVFELPAHTAPLGLAFVDSKFSGSSRGDILVALHGSWNSSTKVGYKIVKLSVVGTSVGGMEDFLTGWLQKDEVLGRPVDLIFDDSGKLFISDDHANLVYIMSKN